MICQNSDAVIAISNPFRDSLNNISPNSRIEVILNNYPAAFDRNNKIEKGLIGGSQIIRICYVGSFGHWNNPEPYLRLLEMIAKNRRFSIEAKFIVPLQSFPYLDAFLDKTTINRSKITRQSSSQENVFEHMSDCVAGLQIMTRQDDRLSIKFVEYLAAGLPVIVSENVRGAADIVREYEVGFVLLDNFSNSEEALEFILNVSMNRKFWRDKCQNLAKKMFSTNVVSDKLLCLYETI